MELNKWKNPFDCKRVANRDHWLLLIYTPPQISFRRNIARNIWSSVKLKQAIRLSCTGGNRFIDTLINSRHTFFAIKNVRFTGITGPKLAIIVFKFHFSNSHSTDCIEMPNEIAEEMTNETEEDRIKF